MAEDGGTNGPANEADKISSEFAVARTSEDKADTTMAQLEKVTLRGIIDRLELEFAPGFNVLTGETGAGKSILVGASQVIFIEEGKLVIRGGRRRRSRRDPGREPLDTQSPAAPGGRRAAGNGGRRGPGTGSARRA